ncbi:hypothetical protein KBY96_07115, partial [Cyanobium sp. ATX 6A2]|uniref:hypothetical protein n=1 Tax=Cyanobium sp. ATX 6A2 TaxID=2823700 RepID=UPI0020CD140F
ASFGSQKGEIRPIEAQIRQKLFIPSKLEPWPLFQGSLPRGSLSDWCALHIQRWQAIKRLCKNQGGWGKESWSKASQNRSPTIREQNSSVQNSANEAHLPKPPSLSSSSNKGKPS